jgi:hypothetical protein
MVMLKFQLCFLLDPVLNTGKVRFVFITLSIEEAAPSEVFGGKGIVS